MLVVTSAMQLHRAVASGSPGPTQGRRKLRAGVEVRHSGVVGVFFFFGAFLNLPITKGVKVMDGGDGLLLLLSSVVYIYIIYTYLAKG